MHLKSLTLKGFKSFASATTLKFEPGICAVVGPNGSGKSNVVDALAWVMGEGSAKTLRGGKMQDVIFAGAGDRKPLGRAEVTLTIDNSDGALPIEYTEVSVTRRMFRDGASEYEINGAKARLMDIQELLSDSGIGREMHIIVGQGKLAEILESRPEDRRSYIEEAAGVLKHRRRKEKAQRKLVNMQANLDRLTDLTAELGKQLKPLARQAEVAQRAATVQADLRDARLQLAGDRIVRVRAEYADSQRQAELLVEQVDMAAQTLEEVSEQQLQLEDELNAVSPQADAAQQLWFELSSLAERVAATLRIAAERAHSSSEISTYHGVDPQELLARAEFAEAEHAELVMAAEEAAEALEATREEAEHRREAYVIADKEHTAALRAIADKREGLVRLITQEEALAHKVAAIGAEILRDEETVQASALRVRALHQEADETKHKVAQLDKERAELEEAFNRAQAETHWAEERFEQLRSTQQNLQKNVYSLQSRIDTLAATVAPESNLAEHFRPLAEAISTDYATAVATALGNFAEAHVGDVDAGDIDKLMDTQRVSIIAPALMSGASTAWRMDIALSDDASWLLDFITADAAIMPTLNRMLADVVLVDTFTSACDLVASEPRLRAVTPHGVFVGAGWVQVGAGSRSRVEVSAQIGEAEKQLQSAQHDLAELAGRYEGAKVAADEARIGEAGAKSALREHDAQAVLFRRELSRLEAQLQSTEKDHARIARHATELERQLAEAKEELELVRDRLSRADDSDEGHDVSSAERDAAQSAWDQAKSMELEASMALRSAQDRANSTAGKGASLRRQAEQEQQARARHERAMKKRRAQGELARCVQRHAADLTERVADALMKATRERDELQHRRNELNSALHAVKQAVSNARRRVEQLRDSAHAGDVARSQAQVRVDEAEAKITEQLGIAISDLLENYSPSEDFDRAAQTKRLKQAEKDLSALGKVNPLALEEYKALEERYSFLSTQLDDVISARKDLQDVIAEVDDKILQLFAEAWNDVEAEFPRVFSTLFPGGEGRLILTEPDSLLTSGIEVEARPPGKKVKRLSLLSGGEKSLTALAMLVAIFRARPSPFYVMDEVEAALDDVNLRRLIALFEQLRADSQLIVITHQKPTMDVANVLYGVTMRGDGVTRVISQRMNPGALPPATPVPSVDASELD
ncbi:MAG: chromosome segregation protein SMC [Corynebacterium sp.]|nr:chromosome segregation protein SMC [Corynebacterium sp.]